MNQRLTAAVAGTGFIGPVHVEALKRIGVHVKGVAGISPEEAAEASKSLGLEKAYASFEEILTDEEVQVVHLAVPNVLHYEMAKKALLAGKNVMCEKPLAMNSKETSELVDLAKEKGLAAGVCYNLRFYPLNLEARERIQSGALGDLFSVVGSYVQDWLMYDTDYNWRVLAEEGGELRAVADIGTHWMDLIYAITGKEVEAVFADLQTVHPIRKRPKGEIVTFSGKQPKEEDLESISINTEDSGSILFRFKGGGTANLWVSQVTAGKKNCLRYEISGSKSSLAWNSERPNELWMGNRNEPNQMLLKDPGLLGETASGYVNYPGGHNEGFPDAFKQCFRAFYNAIRENIPAEKALYPTFEEGHKEVELCEAILESNRTEKWVTIK